MFGVSLIKLVFDSNSYIAAALKRGSYSEYWLRQLANKHSLFISVEILAEIQRKLEQKFDFSRAASAGFAQEILLIADLIHPSRELTVVKADPADNKILECALEARADLIITADKHLLKLKEFEGAGITHPSDLKYIFPHLA